MKLLLPIALISTLASCTGIKDPMRPSAEVPNQGAPATNKVLDAYSEGVGLEAKIAHDVTDDTIAYGGRVADRQARNYTKIGFNSVRRADDLAFREANRYTDYGMDTVDGAADLSLRPISRWPKFASKTAKRAFGSTGKVYKASMHAYGDAVDRTYFSFWDIFNPPEPTPWMVGSVNDRVRPAKVPGGVLTADFAPSTPAEAAPAGGYGGGRIMK